MAELVSIRKRVKKYVDNADEKSLQIIYSFLEANQQIDWWDELPNTTKKEIEQSNLDFESNAIFSHADVVQKFKKWGLK